MEIKQIVKTVLRWWWLGIIPLIIVAAHTGLTYRRPATTYQVVMRFSAGSEPAEELSADYDRYYTWLSSEYIARGLADVSVTGVFADKVTQRLAEQGVEIPEAALQGAIVSDYAQSVLVIYLTWPDPQQIIPVADALTAELTQNAAYYYPQLDKIEPALRRIDEPQQGHPLSPSLKAQLLGPVMRMALAAAIGLGLILLAHCFDPLVRECSELEKLGLPVIATIPRKNRHI